MTLMQTEENSGNYILQGVPKSCRQNFESVLGDNMFRTKWLKLAQMVQDNLDGPKVIQKYRLKIMLAAFFRTHCIGQAFFEISSRNLRLKGQETTIESISKLH